MTQPGRVLIRVVTGAPKYGEHSALNYGYKKAILTPATNNATASEIMISFCLT